MNRGIHCVTILIRERPTCPISRKLWMQSWAAQVFYHLHWHSHSYHSSCRPLHLKASTSLQNPSGLVWTRPSNRARLLSRWNTFWSSACNCVYPWGNAQIRVTGSSQSITSEQSIPATKKWHKSLENPLTASGPFEYLWSVHDPLALSIVRDPIYSGVESTGPPRVF
jgi:hypothetical protein